MSDAVDQALAEEARTQQQPFTCFHCGDGNTALYCLNCASGLSRERIEALESALKDLLSVYDGVDKQPKAGEFAAKARTLIATNKNEL